MNKSWTVCRHDYVTKGLTNKQKITNKMDNKQDETRYTNRYCINVLILNVEWKHRYWYVQKLKYFKLITISQTMLGLPYLLGLSMLLICHLSQEDWWPISVARFSSVTKNSTAEEKNYGRHGTSQWSWPTTTCQQYTLDRHCQRQLEPTPTLLITKEVGRVGKEQWLQRQLKPTCKDKPD